MRRFLAFLLLFASMAIGASAQDATPGFTVNSFDGQYIYYNDNEGVLHRRAVSPVQSKGAPQTPLGQCNTFDTYIDTLTNNFYFCNAAGAWVQISGSGGGASPGAPVNSIQCNGGGVPATLAACNATDVSGVFTINEALVAVGNFTANSSANVIGALSAGSASIIGNLNVGGDSTIFGPNPAADVRAFGKFTTFSSATASTVSGSAAITLSSVQSFKNGEYVTLYNAGASCGLSTPGTPTVTPGVSSGALNTVAAPVGSSSFSYQIVAADKFGCYSPASVAGTTTTGNSLGMKTLTVSTLSRSNNIVTVTTTTAHGLAVGQLVHLVYFSSSDATFEGFWVVNSIGGSTSFTFIQGYDTRFGATTSATSGTLKVFNANSITWTAVPGSWKYYIYGRTGGTFNLLGQSLTTSYVDFGSPMNDNQTFPSFIPATAPITGANDHLTAKILSGGGSTTLTLALVAGISKTTTIVSDDGPALIAAAQSASAVYIPSVGLGINSYTILPPAKDFRMGGDIESTDTIENSAFDTWESVSGGTTGSFASSTGRQLTGTAYPQMVLKASNSFNRFQFTCPAPNGCLNTVDSIDAVHVGFDYTAFGTGNGGLLDYIGMNQLFMGGGFNFRYNKCLFTTGVGGPNDTTNVGNTPVPSVLFTARLVDSNSTANVVVYSSWFTNRGSIAFNYGINGISWVILKDIQTQSISLPTIQFTGANLTGGLNAQDITVADRATAFFSNYSFNPWGPAFLKNISSSSGSRGTLTGLPFTGLAIHGVAVLGQNTGYVDLDGGILTDGNVLASVAGTPMAIPTGVPTAAVTAGGSVPVGTWVFGVIYGDANGLLSSLTNPSTNAVTSGGNQTITITRPGGSLPVGATTWAPYASNGGGYARVPCAMQAMSSTTYVWSTSSTCGITVFSASATTSSISATGLLAPSLKLWSNGFTSATDFPTLLTANRLLHIPNASGTLALLEIAQTWTLAQTFSAKAIFNAAQSTTFTDFPTMTTPGNPSSGNIRVYGDSGSGNLTCLTSSGASCLAGGGAGTPGGSSTQVQVNVASAFAGSVNLTYVSPALSIGSAAGATGQLKMVGTTSGTVTVQSQDIAGTWTLKLPATAGSANLPLITDGSGVSSWTLLPVAGGGSGAATFTVNQLLAGNGTSAFQSVNGSTMAASPILTLKSPTAAGVALTLDTASSPTGDILRIQVNTVKTSWFDSLGVLHTPNTTYTGSGAFAASGTEGTCPAALSGAEIICLGDSVTHTGRLSNNGLNNKAIVQSSNDNPTAHGVAIWGLQFPQLNSTGSGTSGQPLCSQGGAADPIYCNIAVLAGGTGTVTNTAHGVLLGQGTSAITALAPSATANLPLLSQIGADPIYGALPLSDTTLSGQVPIDRGGTGATTLAGANIVTVTGAISANDCVKWSSSTVITTAGAPCGGSGGTSRLDQILAATLSNSINNGINPQTWNWALTGTTTAFKFGENTAATGATNILVQISTLATSTAKPFQVDNNGNGFSMSNTGATASIGTGTIQADKLNQALNTTAPITGGGTQTSVLTIGCATCAVTNSSNTFSSGTHDFTAATITMPTQSAGDSSTKGASTAFVTTAIATVPFRTGTASDVTGQSTSQGAVTLATAPTAARYQINYYADVSAACTTGANSVSFTFNWTDGTAARSLTTGLLSLAAGAPTISSYLSGIFPIQVGSGNVTYTSTVGGSCASGTSTYDVHAELMRIQ